MSHLRGIFWALIVVLVYLAYTSSKECEAKGGVLVIPPLSMPLCVKVEVLQ